MYATAYQVREEMAQLPDRVTDEYIDAVIKKAATYIDSAIGIKYVMPIVDPIVVPEMVKMLTLDLSVFFLYERLYSANAPNLDEYQKVRYDRVMELIGKITSGEIVLPGVIEISPDPTSNGFGSTTEDHVNIFSYEDPEW